MVKWHLEGMGLRGVLVASLLEQWGVDFSWCDIGDHFCAWPASTGTVLPNDPGYRLWMRGTWWPGIWERAQWWKWTNGKPGAADHEVSLHCNVPNLVQTVRERNISRYHAFPEKGQPVLITHGFDACKWYVWGWSAQVQGPGGDARKAYTVRKGRTEWYAYPLAGTNTYLAGTAHAVQRLGKARQLDAEAHLLRWLDRVPPLLGVDFRPFGPAKQGWRPQPKAEDLTLEGKVRQVAVGPTLSAELPGGRWQLRPGGARGLAGFPELIPRIQEVVRGSST